MFKLVFFLSDLLALISKLVLALFVSIVVFATYPFVLALDVVAWTIAVIWISTRKDRDEVRQGAPSFFFANTGFHITQELFHFAFNKASFDHANSLSVYMSRLDGEGKADESFTIGVFFSLTVLFGVYAVIFSCLTFNFLFDGELFGQRLWFVWAVVSLLPVTILSNIYYSSCLDRSGKAEKSAASSQ